MPAQKQTKKQRIEEAREAARIAREKREKRQRLLRVLVPTLVSVGVLVIVGIVIAVVAIQPKPAAAFPGGPKNMQSDGIVFEAQGGTAIAVTTPALKKGQKPKATDWSAAQGIPHVVTYVDLSCPACKAFEAKNASTLKKMVADGTATLEIHPIAILQRSYTTDYSDRSANVAACIANYAPDKFLTALPALYTKQAAEGSAGLTNDEMISIIRKAGVKDDRIDACIRGDSFKSWVTAATERTTTKESLQQTQNGQKGFFTPTITVNDKVWDGTGDLSDFIAAQS